VTDQPQAVERPPVEVDQAAQVIRAGEVDDAVEPTGDARVDAALSRLSGLAALPVAEHVDVYAVVHDGLAEALADLDD
jgi:hypothetical protein